MDTQLYTQAEVDKIRSDLLEDRKQEFRIARKIPFYVLKSNAGVIFASFDNEPSDEEMDIAYAKYLREDSLPSGTASWNCVLYRIFVGNHIECWNGRYTGSKYNWKDVI
jgi:hypothetical protein